MLSGTGNNIFTGRYAVYMLLFMLFAPALCSCVYDDAPSTPASTDGTIMSLDLKMPVQRAADDNGYEEGNIAENYIGIATGNYRIYFFTADNKYIDRFCPMDIRSVNNGTETGYELMGIVPEAVAAKTGFKIVVLANWEKYADDTALVPGVTTIEEICSADWAKYSYNSAFFPDSQAGRGIPMYGVHEYKNVTFTQGGRTELAEPVALLRAMAKVEVLLDNEDCTLTEVKIHGCNRAGYCAPSGVYVQGDYDHDGDWNADYVKELHLVGGANDVNSSENIENFNCVEIRNGTTPETWVVYLPEYSNTSAGRACIECRFDFQKPTDEPYRIWFSDYDTAGQPVSGTDYNISRNNCYSFTINIDRSGFRVKVDKWLFAFDNKYEF